MPGLRYMHTSLGEAVNWRAEMREAGVERRAPPSNSNQADRGYVEQPGEGTPDKPPPSAPPLRPPHSQKAEEAPVVLRRPVTALTPPPPPLQPALAEKVVAAGERLASERQPSLPHIEAPKSEPKPDSRSPVKLDRSPPSANAPMRIKTEGRGHNWGTESKAALVQLFLESGKTQVAFSREMGIAQANISRWMREAKNASARPSETKHGQEREEEMTQRKDPSQPKRSRRAFSEEVRIEAIGRVLALGAKKGDAARVQREMGLAEPGKPDHHGPVSRWVKDHIAEHGRRMPKGYKPAPGASTMISNGPRSAVASKPNGAGAASKGTAKLTLPPFLQGMEEFIEQLVEQRLEERLKPMMLEVMRNTSMLEWMKS